MALSCTICDRIKIQNAIQYLDLRSEQRLRAHSQAHHLTNIINIITRYHQDINDVTN